jgi:hypothetical protein
MLLWNIVPYSGVIEVESKIIFQKQKRIIKIMTGSTSRISRKHYLKNGKY